MRHIPFICKLWSHPTLTSISTYIQNCYSYFFFKLWYLHRVMELSSFVFLRVSSSSPRISRFNAIFKSFCPPSGTHWNEILRNIIIKTTQVFHVVWRWLSQRANFASSQGLNTHWLPHTTLDLTTKRIDWGWATDLKHEARTPNPEPRSQVGTCTTVSEHWKGRRRRLAASQDRTVTLFYTSKIP